MNALRTRKQQIEEFTSASSEERLSILKDLEKCPFSTMTSFIQCAVQDFDKDVLLYLKSLGLDSRICKQAIESGNLDLLIWTHSQEFMFKYGTCASIATKHGHLEILKWCFRMRFVLNFPPLIRTATLTGNQEIIDWLKETDPVKDRKPHIKKYKRILIKRLDGCDLPLPKYATSGSSGFDLSTNENVMISANSTEVIRTGFSFAVPQGYEIQIRSRSGLALKGITVANSPGTIDSDYRGEVCVILTNRSSEEFVVLRGDRVAQGVVCAICQWKMEEVQDLDETERGDGGFGSTGI